MTLLGDDSPLLALLLLLLSTDFLMGESAGDLQPPVDTSSIFSLGMILTSVGFGGGDFSDCLSPKYGQVQGGGRRKDAALSEASDLLPSSELSLARRMSWKLEPLFLHRGDGDSSLESPSWKVEARRLLGSTIGGDSGPREHSSPTAVSSEEQDLKQMWYCV